VTEGNRSTAETALITLQEEQTPFRLAKNRDKEGMRCVLDTYEHLG